jgi:hypothetical protein
MPSCHWCLDAGLPNQDCQPTRTRRGTMSERLKELFQGDIQARHPAYRHHCVLCNCGECRLARSAMAALRRA